MDTVTPQVRSTVMAAVRGKGTRLEEDLAQRLKEQRVRNFKRNPQDIYGRPDFVFSKQRVVIFVDSCFWHGCRWHCRMPASNQTYWREKIARNRKRDLQVNRFLRTKGWKVIRVWEHQLRDRKKLLKALDRIKNALKS